MKSLLLAVLIVPSMAFATGGSHTSPKQDQDQSQTQSQETKVDQANEQNVSFNGVEQVSSAIAPSVFASHPCALGGSGALGVKGLNIGGGKQKIDKQCEARELARLFLAANERELAVTLLCTTEAAEVLGDACKPNVTQAELRERIKTLLEEREHDAARCEDSKDRISEACKK